MGCSLLGTLNAKFPKVRGLGAAELICPSPDILTLGEHDDGEAKKQPILGFLAFRRPMLDHLADVILSNIMRLRAGLFTRQARDLRSHLLSLSGERASSICQVSQSQSLGHNHLQDDFAKSFDLGLFVFG